MKAAFLVDRNTFECRETPVPTINDGESLVRVTACGFCGSDVHDAMNRPDEPRTPGHEFAGVIEDIRGDGLGFEKGDRAVLDPIMRCGECRFCREGRDHLCETMGVIGCQTPGGFADYVRVPNRNLRRIPEGLSEAAATLADPLGVVLHACDLAGGLAGKSCLVYGAGTLGLLMIQVLRNRGASYVAVSDVSQPRLDIAKKLANVTTVNAATDPEYKAVEGVNFDVCFELAGAAPVLPQAIERVGRGGLVVMIAQRPPTEIQCSSLLFGEKRVQGVFGHTSRNYKDAVAMLGSCEVNGPAILTHTFPLGKIQRAFDTVRSPQSVKVIVTPD